MMNDTLTTSRIDWNGVEIEISWAPDWIAYDDCTGTGHLEVRSIAPAREPLPITETGYRSHFINASGIEAHGSPEAFVRLWIEQEAKKV